MRERDRYYTIAETAKALGKSVPTIYRWVKGSKLQARTNPITGRLILAKDEVDKLANAVKEWT